MNPTRTCSLAPSTPFGASAAPAAVVSAAMENVRRLTSPAMIGTPQRVGSRRDGTGDGTTPGLTVLGRGPGPILPVPAPRRTSPPHPNAGGPIRSSTRQGTALEPFSRCHEDDAQPEG